MVWPTGQSGLQLTLMTIINSDTNATLAGYALPVGSFEWPQHGTFSIVTSGGYSNQFTAGIGDTLLVSRSDASLVGGPDILIWVAAGMAVSLLGCGTIGFYRWFGNKISALGDWRDAC